MILTPITRLDKLIGKYSGNSSNLQLQASGGRRNQEAAGGSGRQPERAEAREEAGEIRREREASGGAGGNGRNQEEREGTGGQRAEL